MRHAFRLSRWKVSVTTLSLALAASCVFAQQQTALPANSQSSTQADSASTATQQEHPSTTASSSDSSDDSDRHDVSWRKLPGYFLQDQKNIWLFPTKVAEGHHLLPTAIVTGTTAALIATDPQLMPKIRQTDAFQDSSRALGSKLSGGIIAGVPVAFYAAALIRKNPYDQGTSLLAGEAVVDDAIVMIAMKAVTRRLRPTDIAVTGDYSDTFFHSDRGPLGKASSFPSGHAMMSFSVATIFAHRYRQHRWVPYVAYGLAGVISLTRVTTGAHFPSDIFIGAALGYGIARYGVLHSH